MKKMLFAVLAIGSISVFAEEPPAPPAPAPASAPAPAPAPAPVAAPAKGSAPGGGAAAAFTQHANIGALKSEIVDAAMAAARAPDEKTRVMEWKRVDGVDRKFSNMLNAPFNGEKLSKEDRQAAQHAFYVEVVNGIKEVEAQVQDPDIKAFFDKKLVNYERKLGQGQKKPEAKKKAPQKKKHDAKKKPDPKKDAKKNAKKQDSKHKKEKK